MKRLLDPVVILVTFFVLVAVISVVSLFIGEVWYREQTGCHGDICPGDFVVHGLSGIRGQAIYCNPGGLYMRFVGADGEPAGMTVEYFEVTKEEAQ